MNLSSNLANGNNKSKFSFSNKVLYFGIVSLVIIVVGMIFLLGFGFNYSFDYAGGYTMTVNAGATIDDSKTYGESVSKIDEIMGKYSLVAYSVYKVGNGDAAAIVVNYKKPAKLGQGEIDSNNNKVVTEVEEALKGDNSAFNITLDEVAPSSAKAVVLNTLWVFAVAAVAVCIYMFIRHKFMFALNLLIAIVHDVLLVISLAAITRIRVGKGFFAILGLTMVVTIVMYALNACKLKDNRVKQSLKDESNEVVVDVTLKQNILTNVFISLLLIVCMFSLSAMGAIEFIAVLYATIAVLVVLYSQHLVICPLWAKLIKKDGFNVYSKAIKLNDGSKKEEEQEVEIISE